MPKWLLVNRDRSLQKQMKKAFPKLNKNDRLIPRFRGACARDRDRKAPPFGSRNVHVVFPVIQAGN